MSAEPLFPDTERTDPEQCRANESNYGFLQRVDDPVFANVRAVFNEWFGRFAEGQVDEAIRDLRNRFKGKGSEQFYGAFWELYLHETLVRLGFEIKVHPKSERGTRPDFVLGRGDERLYLEAVSLFPGFSNHKEPQNVDTVIEYVSEAFDPKWRFRLRHVFAGKQSPKKKAVTDAVLNWLGTLDWEAGWRGSMANSPHPEKDIEVDDWVIGLTALPMPPEAHGDEEARMVALFRGIGGYPDGLGREILPKLERKANKYGDLDAPHVVALWVMDAMASERTAPLALFGTGITTKPGVHLTGLPPLSGKPVGLWAPGAKNRGRASAVLAVDSMSFNYSAASRVLPHLWLNPWADHQLEVDLPYASSRVSNDEASVENLPAATTASELFGLPEDWPGRPFEARRQRRAGTRTGTRDWDSA